MPSWWKRRRLWIALGLVLFLLAGLGLWLASGGSRKISAENFEAIQPGMPRADVDALLGAGNAGRARPLPGGGVQVDYIDPDPSRLSPGDMIRLDFDSQGRVAAKQFFKVTPGEVLTNLRKNWLGF